MKVFVTGVGGQLGHDVMNELHKRGYEGVGSDLAPAYGGIQDGSAVTRMPYISLDITDRETVWKIITEVKPDAVIHCAGWTAVDAAEDADKQPLVRKINVERNYNGGPVGLDTIAAAIGEDPTTIEDVYEPYLMQIGFLSRTPRGRMVTPAGYRHLGMPMPGNAANADDDQLTL